MSYTFPSRRFAFFVCTFLYAPITMYNLTEPFSPSSRKSTLLARWLLFITLFFYSIVGTRRQYMDRAACERAQVPSGAGNVVADSVVRPERSDSAAGRFFGFTYRHASGKGFLCAVYSNFVSCWFSPC